MDVDNMVEEGGGSGLFEILSSFVQKYAIMKLCLLFYSPENYQKYIHSFISIIDIHSRLRNILFPLPVSLILSIFCYSASFMIYGGSTKNHSSNRLNKV